MTKSQKAAFNPMDFFSALTPGAEDTQPAMIAAWQDIVTQNTEFLTQRLAQDLETQQALLACKTPADVVKVQTEFFSNAMQQYSQQASKVFARMTAPAGNHARGYDDVPL